MATTNTSNYLFSIAVRDAITRLAQANGVSGFEPGWEPPRYTGHEPDRGRTLIVMNVVTTAVAGVVVCGRVYSRAFVVGSFGWDDYSILGALVSGRVMISPPVEVNEWSADARGITWPIRLL